MPLLRQQPKAELGLRQLLKEEPRKGIVKRPIKLFPWNTIEAWPPPNYVYVFDLINKDQNIFLWRNGAYWIAIDRSKDNLLLSSGIEKTGKLPDDIDEEVKKYKIHLMPKQSNFVPVVNKLIDLLFTNPDLRSIIYQFKIKSDIKNLYKNNLVMPLIAIYPISGKENAQKALDIIYDEFKNIGGLNITPRWNRKVTSLIYFAQGNADDKIRFAAFFDPGDDTGRGRIYFKSNVTGTEQDYHLKNPSTVKP